MSFVSAAHQRECCAHMSACFVCKHNKANSHVAPECERALARNKHCARTHNEHIPPPQLFRPGATCDVQLTRTSYSANMRMRWTQLPTYASILLSRLYWRCRCCCCCCVFAVLRTQTQHGRGVHSIESSFIAIGAHADNIHPRRFSPCDWAHGVRSACARVERI